MNSTNSALGYFSPLQEGELFCGAMERTKRHFTNQSRARFAATALGHSNYSFGMLLPRHGRKLLANLPPMLGITEQTLKVHSIYPVVAPFLDAVIGPLADPAFRHSR